MFFKKNKYKSQYQKISYSQCGEDLIIRFIFEQLQIIHPTYIDIGAHHPFYISNTALFYEKGSRGVNIEPDPVLFKEIKKERSLDVCLNVGIGASIEEAVNFYVMSSSTLNTFSEDEAKRYVEYGNNTIKQIIKLPILTINEIISKYFNNKSPNLISLDVEGMDLIVIKSLDFSSYRPEVICVETLSYTEDKTEEKQKEIIEYIIKQGYILYADTYINSVFVERGKWENR
jgi:FkbM family methyltransferase